MDNKNRGNIILGAVIIVLGLALFAMQMLKDSSEAVVLLLIGAAFTAWYFSSRNYGLLIPGCILLGLGLGRVGQTVFETSQGMEQIGLGIGFCGIYVIDLIYQGKSSWWPLIPGGILILTGIAEVSDALEGLKDVGWPLIIVIVGVVVLLNALGVFKRKGQVEETAPEEVEEN